MSEPTITKTAIECYKLRNLSHGTWADISIDTNGTAGRIQISSDYGDWQHYWGACGMPFKEFLIKLTGDVHYVAKKFGAADEYDGPATVRMYRSMIIETRRHDGYSAEEARNLWEETSTIEMNASSADSFYYTINESCPLIYNWMDYSPEFKTMISPLFLRFWNEAWPVFIEELKREATCTSIMLNQSNSLPS